MAQQIQKIEVSLLEGDGSFVFNIASRDGNAWTNFEGYSFQKKAAAIKFFKTVISLMEDAWITRTSNEDQEDNGN